MPAKRGNNVSSKFGSKWIRKEKRLAIYMRDGFRCIYCNRHFERMKDRLQLDHLIPWSKGGTNDESNLVTCCKPCNVARGDQTVEEFVHQFAKGSAKKGQTILKRIAEATSRFDLPLLRTEAKDKIEKGQATMIFQQDPKTSREPADFK